MKHNSKISAAMLAFGMAVTLHAEVRSYTLGVHVNCAPGLGECYPYIREGLLNMNRLAVVPDSPNCANDTVDVKPRAGALMDPAVFAKQIKDLGIGAHLRVMEATVDGHVERRGKEFWLRISGKHEEEIRLMPLTQKAQYNPNKKKQLPLTREERRAYKALTSKVSDDKTIVRITGPVKKVEGKNELSLEVREFEVSPKPEVPKVESAKVE